MRIADLSTEGNDHQQHGASPYRGVGSAFIELAAKLAAGEGYKRLSVDAGYGSPLFYYACGFVPDELPDREWISQAVTDLKSAGLERMYLRSFLQRRKRTDDDRDYLYLQSNLILLEHLLRRKMYLDKVHRHLSADDFHPEKDQGLSAFARSLLTNYDPAKTSPFVDGGHQKTGIAQITMVLSEQRLCPTKRPVGLNDHVNNDNVVLGD